MGWLEALIAGIIQGITEFLPVSSTGHLIIFQTFAGSEDASYLAFNVFLHMATLVSVFVVFHKDVWMLIREFFTAIYDICRGKPNFKTPERRFLLMVIIGTIPAVFVGAGYKLLGMDSVLDNIFVVAVMLIFTAVLMFTIDRFKEGKYSIENAPLNSALTVGLMQAVAILPGLSRSGSTIFGGRFSGLKKDFAIKYSFILSIPAILGAEILILIGVARSGEPLDINVFSWVIGFIAAAIFGIIAIRLIRLLIIHDKFYIFGIYCLFASAFAFLVGFGII